MFVAAKKKEKKVNCSAGEEEFVCGCEGPSANPVRSDWCSQPGDQAAGPEVIAHSSAAVCAATSSLRYLRISEKGNWLFIVFQGPTERSGRRKPTLAHYRVCCLNTAPCQCDCPGTNLTLLHF